MICKLDAQTSGQLDGPLAELLTPLFPEDVCSAYAGYLETEAPLQAALSAYFSQPDQYPNVTPIIIYNEQSHELITLMSNNKTLPDETGEPGSILAHVRDNGYTDRVLCSDCYGQLSCSSCAIEVLSGALENPIPREEEYDMLDIDETKPPTEKTRLGCQAQVGSEPLVIKVRAPEKKLISTI